eukprot:gene25800-34386_t
MEDVEAGQSTIKISISKSTPSSHNDSFFSKNYSAVALIYIVFVVVTIFAMFIPIFFEFTNTTGSFGVFGDTLRTSTRLKIMESISVGCALPMLSDKFLDQVTDKNTKMTLSMWHRILFLVAFSISSILYLNLSDYYFMPYLYIVLNNTKVLLVGAVTSYSVLNGSIMNSRRSKYILFIPVVICGLRYVLATYDLLFPGYSFLSGTTTALFYLTFISFFSVQIPWFYLLWCRYRVNKSLNNEEKKECVYMVAMLFYIVACEVVTIVFGFTISWLDTGENVLVGYIVVQIVCILLATVLPTWFMRKVVQLDCAIVSMVRAFAGRMDGFKFLLASKNIALKIEDQAQVSEFYSPNEDGRELEVPLSLSLRSSHSSVYFP